MSKEELLKAPHQFIDKLFEEWNENASGNNKKFDPSSILYNTLSLHPNFGWKTPPNYQPPPNTLFETDEALQIPLIDTKKIENHIEPDTSLFQTGKLVRMKLMVQDSRQLEFFSDPITIKTSQNTTKSHTGLYRDSFPFSQANGEDNFQMEDENDSIFEQNDDFAKNTNERTVFYCVPVPALSQWTVEKDELNFNQSFDVSRKKRPREQRLDVPSDKFILLNANSTHKNENSSSDSRKIYNLPIEGEEGFPFITKIYNYEEGEIKINEVIEVIGIICLPEIKTRKTNEISQPFFSQAHGEDAAYYFEEFILSHIPVLHSISYRKFDYNSNPLLFPFYSPFPNLSFVRNIMEELVVIRTSLVKYLSTTLGGDLITSEYLLLSLLSRIQARKEGLCIGKFSLNISNIPPYNEKTSRPNSHYIFSLISSLLPKSLLYEMTISNLNSSVFNPVKNNEINRLNSGLLQLTNGTYLIFDEAQLSAGTLLNTGVKNLKSLQDLSFYQRVTYNFEYYKTDFDVDYPVLILSEGKSVIKCDCVVPMEAKTEIGEPSFPLPLVGFLDKCRAYLGTVRAMQSIDINEQVAVEMQRYFVQFRQENPTVESEIFHVWLTMARLSAISYGESEISLVRWQSVIELEKIRLSRLTTKN